MKRIASQALLIGLMAGMAAGLVVFWDHPARASMVAGVGMALIALSLLFERIWPFARLKVEGQEVAGDVASLALVFGGLDGLFNWLVPLILLAILPPFAGLGLPLWSEVVVAVLWIEFAAWVSHWAHHRYGPLWALHAMHHSTEQLYTLNNFRFHPLNFILNQLAMIVPLLVVGISADAVLIYAALALPVLTMQHSNIDFDFGWLNLVFNTNELHRWHHSAHPVEGMRNYGRALVIWDRVFGTYLRGEVGQAPVQLGLFEASRTYPAARRFWAQLVWPFGRACCAKA